MQLRASWTLLLALASPCLAATSVGIPPLFSEPHGRAGGSCTASSNDPLLGCSADCSALQFCLSGMIYEVPCREVQPTEPYCNKETKSCQAKPASCDAQFMCTSGDGLYPDPYDCHVFHQCNGMSSKAYKCMDPTVYDPKYEKCVIGVECAALCKENLGRVITYPGSSKIFIYCFADAIVMKCRGDNVIYNPTARRCEYVCAGAGIYRDSEDPAKYYLCEEKENGFEVQHLDCEPDTSFDENYNTCVENM